MINYRLTNECILPEFKIPLDPPLKKGEDADDQNHLNHHNDPNALNVQNDLNELNDPNALNVQNDLNHILGP